MKITDLLFEANIAAKLKDPRTLKMIEIAMRHDSTLPPAKIAKLGPKPEQSKIVQLWSDLLDEALSNTNYGDISVGGKFDDWLTRLYINGNIDYEDLTGESGDSLGAWQALSTRQLLKPEDQDFNRFKSLKELQSRILGGKYSAELQRIKNAALIEKLKRDKREIVIIDDDRFLVRIPLNYAACYNHNNGEGALATFCTGSSSGNDWFRKYASDDMIVQVIDKENANDKNGKWQFITGNSYRELKNAIQESSSIDWNDSLFASLFPGLMARIVDAIRDNSELIREKSVEFGLGRNGYDPNATADRIAKTYPKSYNSTPPEDKEGKNRPSNEISESYRKLTRRHR